MISFRKTLCGLAIFAALLFWIQQKTLLVVSASPSLPWKVYLVVKGSTWKKGDIVTIQGHVSPSIDGTPLLTKRVRGVAGDRLTYRQEALYVNGEKIGLLQKHNSKGQPLHPVENQLISPAFVYVMGDDPHSFDSRYREFGLVKVEHILGRSFPLW